MVKPTRNQIIAGTACTLGVGGIIIGTVVYNLPKSSSSPENPPVPERGVITSEIVSPGKRPESGNNSQRDTTQTAKADKKSKKTKKSRKNRKTTKLPQTGSGIAEPKCDNKTQKPTKSKKHQKKTVKPPKAKSGNSDSQDKKEHEEVTKVNNHRKEANKPTKPADSGSDKEQKKSLEDGIEHKKDTEPPQIGDEPRARNDSQDENSSSQSSNDIENKVPSSETTPLPTTPPNSSVSSISTTVSESVTKEELEMRLTMMTEALLKEFQDLKYPDDMIEEMNAFLQKKDAASYDAVSKSHGNIVDDGLRLKLTEKMINLGKELIKYLEAANTNTGEMDKAKIALRRLKRGVTKAWVPCHPYLSPQLLNELQVFAIEDLDPKNLLPKEIEMLKQLMGNPNLSLFEMVRFISIFMQLAGKYGEAFLNCIQTYRDESKIWTGLDSTITRTLIYLDVINDPPNPSSPACEHFLKANTLEEWQSWLDQIILEDDPNFLVGFRDRLICFNNKEVGSGDGLRGTYIRTPTFLAVEAAISIHSHIQDLKKNNPNAFGVVEALIKNENVIESAAKVKDILSLLKPFSEYLFARDTVLNVKTGFENWVMLNATFIMENNAKNESAKVELIKALRLTIEDRFDTLRKLKFVDSSHSLLFHFPWYCPIISHELLRDIVPPSIEIPNEKICKSEEMKDLADKLESWLVFYFKTGNSQVVEDIKQYYSSNITCLPDIGFFLSSDQYNNNSDTSSINLYNSYLSFLKLLEKEQPALYQKISTHQGSSE